MAFSMTTIRRTAATSAVAVAFAFGPLLSAIAQAVPLNGAGATFPDPLYQRYAAEIKRDVPEVEMNYQGIGSGGGIKQLIAGTVDFAGSDTAMTDEERDQVNQGVVFVPTAGGPVAVVYNLPGANGLKLSRPVLAGIFAGQITQWNDPKIVTDNPGVNLPNQPIKLAVRADSSGTSYIFTNHLSAIDPYFKGRIGANKAPRWAGQPISAKGNPGVAQTVKQIPGTIGYVEFSFAKTNNLQTALVQDKKGAFVPPTLEGANRALAAVEYEDDYRIDFDKLGDPADGYPITGLTWIMVYKQYDDPAKADAVKKMVGWILGKGQELNDDLDYTRIPEDLSRRVVDTANRDITSGAAAR